MQNALQSDIWAASCVVLPHVKVRDYCYVDLTSSAKQHPFVNRSYREDTCAIKLVLTFPPSPGLGMWRILRTSRWEAENLISR